MKTSLSTPKTGLIKRDDSGRFVAGTQPLPGPGRPPRSVEEGYLQSIQANVPRDEWTKAVRKLLQKAQAGDVRAFETLGKHLLPTSEQRLEIIREVQSDSEEFRVAGRPRIVVMHEMVKRLQEQIARLEAAGERLEGVAH